MTSPKIVTPFKACLKKNPSFLEYAIPGRKNDLDTWFNDYLKDDSKTPKTVDGFVEYVAKRLTFPLSTYQKTCVESHLPKQQAKKPLTQQQAKKPLTQQQAKKPLTQQQAKIAEQFLQFDPSKPYPHTPKSLGSLYRKAARTIHPDKFPNSTPEELKDINRTFVNLTQAYKKLEELLQIENKNYKL